MPIRKHLRLKNYDYSKEGAYFVTICTKEGGDYFGRIKNGDMILNDLGRMIERIWNEIPQNYPGIEIDPYWPAQGPASTDQFSLSDIMHRFKSLTTSLYKKDFSGNIDNFNRRLWHRSFYDRIIRNEKELNDVRAYITNNPKQWEFDGRDEALPRL